MERRDGIFFGFVLVASAVLSLNASSYWTGDYPVEAGPVIDSLVHGHTGEFLSSRALMGPVSLLLRAPFAALALLTGGGGADNLYENAYRFGVFPCVVAGGLLGVALARIARRRGYPPAVHYLALVLCTVNPATVKAITYGHPEEILTAALVVGAAIAGVYARPVLAATLLVLGLGTKQWAVLAVIPVVVTMPWKQIRKPLLVLAGLGLLAVAPIVIAEPSTFTSVQRQLLDVRGAHTFPTSIWWLFERAVPGEANTVDHQTPGWVGAVAHPLILVAGVIVPLLLARRVREDPVRRALALLALVMLLRAALDPVNNSYYHLPFLVALVAADALTGSMLASLLATAGLIGLIQLAGQPRLQAVFYLVWALPFSAYLAGRAWGVDWAALLRSRGVRGRAAAQTVHPS
ncbi:MAG: glycosyltransferase 87 family protein [Thermoleophilaceae bacterium]